MKYSRTKVAKIQTQKTLVQPSLQSHKKLLLWITAGIFTALQIFFTIQTVTSGATLAQLEQQESELQKKNQTLSKNLVEKSSLTHVSSVADELGFAKPQNLVYINAEEFVAKLP